MSLSIEEVQQIFDASSEAVLVLVKDIAESLAEHTAQIAPDQSMLFVQMFNAVMLKAHEAVKGAKMVNPKDKDELEFYKTMFEGFTAKNSKGENS